MLCSHLKVFQTLRKRNKKLKIKRIKLSGAIQSVGEITNSRISTPNWPSSTKEEEEEGHMHLTTDVAASIKQLAQQQG